MAGAASHHQVTHTQISTPQWDFLGETDFPANTLQGSAPLVFVQREEYFLSATAGRFPKSGQQFTPLRRLFASAATFGMSARSIVSLDPISGRSPCSYRNTVHDGNFLLVPINKSATRCTLHDTHLACDRITVGGIL